MTAVHYSVDTPCFNGSLNILVVLISSWSNKPGNISQKILKGIRSEAPLKTRIDTTQKKLETQILRLDGIHTNLQKKDDALFKKIVDAQRIHDTQSARTYALELNEVRKIKNVIGNAKLAMDQVKTRLSTVSEFGDIVVTLSPCMSMIKGISDSVGGIMPGANDSIDEFTKTINEVLTGSSMDSAPTPQTAFANPESESIMQEVARHIEDKVTTKLPDIPKEFKVGVNPPSKVNLKHDIIADKQVYT